MSKNLLFHEVYGSYYNVIAEILAEAVKGKLNRKRMMAIVREKAFSESIMNIPDMLRSGKWPLLDEEYETEIIRKPQMPLTAIQKRWMKAILADPRISLFFAEQEPEELKNVKPLFMQDTIVYYDRYADGDPFTDLSYIRNFHMIREALEDGKAMEICYLNRRNRESIFLCIPHHLEYSSKDDKFRLHAQSLEKKRQFAPQQLNLARIIRCKTIENEGEIRPPQQEPGTAVLELLDVDNTLERAMLQFSYLEKETERIQEDGQGPGRYRITLYYDKSDETEVLIRILSFGPGIWVTAPDSLREEIRQRLTKQKQLLMLD